MTVLDDIFQKRQQPTVGGLPFQFLELFDTKDIIISFYYQDPLTCKSKYWYDSRHNTLYVKKVIGPRYIAWHAWRS